MTAPNSGPSEKISLATHSTFWIAALCVVVFTVWASISTLDIVRVAVGEVIPSFQVKTVQHLEGGIVCEIMVREGSEVKANQPLIVLELTVSSADVAELRVRLTSLETDIAQFEALSEGKDTATFLIRYIFKTTVLYQVYTVNWIIHCSSTLQKFRSSEVNWQRTV